MLQQLQAHQQQQAAAAQVRHMGGRTHKLSLKKANNKASWLAVQPFLEQPQGAGTAQVQRQAAPIIDTVLPPLPALAEPPLHQKIGRITGPYAVAPQDCFAVIETGGSQFKVTADDVIYHNKIPGVRVNDVLEFGKVLLLGGLADTTIGRPFIPGASVVAAVEENFKDTKVWVFKKKKRKRYSRLFGHRSQITALRILEVRQPTQEQVDAATAALEAGAAAPLPVPAAAAAVTAAPAPHAQEAAPSSSGSSSSSSSSSSADTSVPSEQPSGGEAAAPAALQQQGKRRRPRVPLHLVGRGRQHGPPAVTNVWSIEPGGPGS